MASPDGWQTDKNRAIQCSKTIIRQAILLKINTPLISIFLLIEILEFITAGPSSTKNYFLRTYLIFFFILNGEIIV